MAFLRSCPRPRGTRAACSREKQVSAPCAFGYPPRAIHLHCALLPAACVGSVHVCALSPCAMLLRCAPPRSACPSGSHAQHRQVRDVAVRAHATFATTRPGVCPLPQASAAAPLHWPLTTPSRAAVSPHIVSYPTCARTSPPTPCCKNFANPCCKSFFI